MLRKHRIPDANDQLKDLTRGKKVTKEIIQEFIKSLDIPEGDKNILLALTPASYTGFAAQIVQDQLKPYC